MKNKIDLPRIVLSDHEKIWVEKIYERVKANKEVNYRLVRAELVNEIPIDFSPSSIDSKIIDYRSITLLGILIIDPNSDILDHTNTVYSYIRSMLIKNANLKSFNSIEISKALELKEDQVSIVLELIGKYGSFWNGAQGRRDGIFGYEVITIERDNVFYEYLRYKDFYSVLDTYLKKHYPENSNNEEVSEEVFFPIYPNTSLKKEDVITYLELLQLHGWKIYTSSSNKNEFIIDISESARIHIFFSAEEETIITLEQGRSWTIGKVRNVGSLEKIVKEAANKANIDLTLTPESLRLIASEPASNIGKLCTMVGTAMIEGIFDPYLDEKALSRLLAMSKLGLSFSSNVRMLTSNSRNFSETYIKDWFKELGINHGEIRKTLQNEHRRFLLISGGQSIIIGNSLNQFDKNEVIAKSSDKEDKAFFNSEWSKSTTINIVK